MNKEGNSPTIEYQHWTGQKWIASLQDARIQFEVEGIKSTIDPDFHHVRQDGYNPHDDQWIQYVTSNGSKWASKCHSHGGIGDLVTFSFEHFHSNDLDNADHEDKTIIFKDWAGGNWQLSLPDVDLTDRKPYAKSIFHLKKLP